jgi:hypothetical protein
MRPRCFSKAILYHGAPLPSTGSVRATFPGVSSTIRALRLPVLTTELLISSRLRPNRSSLLFAPMRRREPLGPVPLEPGTTGYSSVGQTQEIPGSWRIHPVPLPRSRIPASSSGLTLSPKRCSPHLADSEDTDFTDMSRLNHAASVPAAYASSSVLPHRLQGSLPAGG